MTEKNIYPAAVYGFLEFISQHERTTDTHLGRKILDCAAEDTAPLAHVLMGLQEEFHDVSN